MKKLKLLTSIEESYDELRYKTSWPTRTQLIKSACIVMIASVIIALIILVMDQVVETLMHFIYSLHSLSLIHIYAGSDDRKGMTES